MAEQNFNELGPPPLAESLYPENGRWYLEWPKDNYLLPVDKPEHDRLDIFHKMFRVVMNDRLYTPRTTLMPGARVLDIGCGTGIWIMQLARELYPMDCLLVGVDIQMSQPASIPITARFTPADIESPWTEELRSYGPYDLVTCRLMRGAITSWRGLFSRVAAHLTPGTGVFEHIELDWVFKNDSGPVPPTLVRWADEISRAMDDHKTPIRFSPEAVKAMLRAAGFVDIREEKVQIPIGNWPMTPHEQGLGRWCNLALSHSALPMALAPLTRVHRRSLKYVHELAQMVKDELHSQAQTDNVYCTLYIWTANISDKRHTQQ